MTRKPLLVSAVQEKKLIAELTKKFIETYPDVSADNALVVMVSPDYSATVAMHLAHSLSIDGEMCDILPIHVPYPDEDEYIYVRKADQDIDNWFKFSEDSYKYYILVEGGVIRGGNYTWLTKLFNKKVIGTVITTSLYENIGSRFKSDVVAKYYDNTKQDLTFYFERENKHWN
jgi:tRNA G10  N-methylase Trm11